MSRLLAVATRELRERWLLFPAALAGGLFPLVLPAFGVRHEDALVVVGILGAVLFGTAAAVVIGSSMLARDAANGRLGFLFSRPLSWRVIWGGKWVAAVVLVAATGFLTALPTMVAHSPEGSSWGKLLWDGPGSVLLAILVVLTVGLANFNATAFRSRSPWVALDLACLVAAIWATRRYVAPLFWHEILTPEWAGTLSLLPLALGFLAGSLVQVAVGRTDLRRAHRVMSHVFWGVVAATLVGAASYLTWIRSAGPAEVIAFAVTSGPGGRWAYVEGRTERGGGRGVFPVHACLVDTTSGRYWIRPYAEPDERAWGFGAVFTADGRWAVLPHGGKDGVAVTLLDLASPSSPATEVELESSPPPTWAMAFAVSPGSDLVLVAHPSGVSLYALPSGRRVATATVAPGFIPSAVRFLSTAAARVWLVPGGVSPNANGGRPEMRVVDLGPDGTSRAVTFSTAAPMGVHNRFEAVVPDALGSRIVTTDAGVHLRDGATGDLVATLAEASRLTSAAFLSDGRIVVSDGGAAAGRGPASATSGALLKVFAADGAPLDEIRLDLPSAGLSAGPEVAPGRVLASSFLTTFTPGQSVLVDVDERREIEKLPGLRPAVGFALVTPERVVGTRPGSVQFFRDVAGRVLRIDLATGERKVVAGPGAPSGERFHFGR